LLPLPSIFTLVDLIAMGFTRVCKFFADLLKTDQYDDMMKELKSLNKDSEQGIIIEKKIIGKL